MSTKSVDMKLVQSSSIKSIGYDPSSSTLHIEFSSGGTYHYAGVSPDDFAAFESADSVGKHHHAHIKNKFTCTKVSG